MLLLQGFFAYFVFVIGLAVSRNFSVAICQIFVQWFYGRGFTTYRKFNFLLIRSFEKDIFFGQSPGEVLSFWRFTSKLF